MYNNRKVFKKITNNGDPCKIYVTLAGHNDEGAALLFRRYTLTSDVELYSKYQMAVKTFKGKTLFYSTFQIKINTLNEVIKWLNELNNSKQKQ